jgi:hypothetical protein
MNAGDAGGALGLCTTMRRIRAFENRVGELFVRGESAGAMQQESSTRS